MTLFGGLFGENRSIENPQVPISSSSILSWLLGPNSDVAGVKVGATTSLQMAAVWRAVNLLAGTAAALPLKAYKVGTQEPAPATLLANPHPDMTPFELWETVFVHLTLWGNAYLQKVRNGAGAVVELWPIHPSRISVGRVRPWDANPSGKIFAVDDNPGVPYTDREILHIPGLGYDGVCGVSPIRLAAQGIGFALAAEKYGAKLFSAGSLLSGVLQTEQRLQQPDADRLKANWKSKVSGLDNAHEIAVLDSGVKFQPVTMPNTDAQFIESRRFQISEVARWFGIPPHMLMDTDKSTSWGTGIEQQSIGFVVYTLRPWLARVEQRVTKEATPAGTYAKYKVEGLLRGDSTARANFYNVMRNIGAFSVNDILDLEDMPNIGPEGDTRLQPLNMAPLGSETANPGGTDAAA